MTMWPQLVFIALSSAGFAMQMAGDKTWGDRTGSIFASLFTFGLLYAGGFFDVLLK